MDQNSGGQTSEARQRRTAAEIARQKVLAAYGHVSDARPAVSNNPYARQAQQANLFGPAQKNPYVTTGYTRPAAQTYSPFAGYQVGQEAVPRQQPAQQTAAQSGQYRDAAATDQNSPAGSYKQLPVNQASVDFKKYHSAWQSYYQKYYSDYYAKAARQYVETERMKDERKRHDEEVGGERDARNYVKQDISEGSVQQVEKTLKQRVQEKAGSRFHFKNKHKKFIPLAAGIVVALAVLFMQYNRLVFAPIIAYISPGNTTDTGIAEIDPTVNETISKDPKLYIPKLNVEVPVAFGISNDTATINKFMNQGVAQFRVPGADAFPGQYGNTVISGHSAGDIYSNNQYKFIFSGLERLTNGDLIYIDYNGVRYTYQMTGRKTVDPSDVDSLVIGSDKKMLTLITCTPLGTSRYRLLIFAEQVSPNDDAGKQNTTTTVSESVKSSSMPSNEKTFFEKLFGN